MGKKTGEITYIDIKENPSISEDLFATKINLYDLGRLFRREPRPFLRDLLKKHPCLIENEEYLLTILSHSKSRSDNLFSTIFEMGNQKFEEIYNHYLEYMWEKCRYDILSLKLYSTFSKDLYDVVSDLLVRIEAHTITCFKDISIVTTTLMELNHYLTDTRYLPILEKINWKYAAYTYTNRFSEEYTPQNLGYDINSFLRYTIAKLARANYPIHSDNSISKSEIPEPDEFEWPPHEVVDKDTIPISCFPMDSSLREVLLANGFLCMFDLSFGVDILALQGGTSELDAKYDEFMSAFRNMSDDEALEKYSEEKERQELEEQTYYFRMLDSKINNHFLYLQSHLPAVELTDITGYYNSATWLSVVQVATGVFLNEKSITFWDFKGQIVKDINLLDIMNDSSILKVLDMEGISTLKKLALMPFEDLTDLFYGARYPVNRLLEIVKNYLVYSVDSKFVVKDYGYHKCKTHTSQEIERWTNQFITLFKPFSSVFETPEFQVLLLNTLDEKDISSFCDDAGNIIPNTLLNIYPIRQIVNKGIIDVLSSESIRGWTFESLCQYFAMEGKELTTFFGSIIAELISVNRIRYIEQLLYKPCRTLKEYLSILEPHMAQILTEKCNRQSLTNIAHSVGLSENRTKDYLREMLSECEWIYEYSFLNIWSKYGFSDTELCELLGCSLLELGFLSAYSKQGKGTVESFLKDEPNIPQKIFKRAPKAFRGHGFILDSQVFGFSRTDIICYLYETKGIKNINKIFNVYHSLLEERGLSENSRLSLKNKQTVCKIILHNFRILINQDGDITTYEGVTCGVNTLLTQLDIWTPQTIGKIIQYPDGYNLLSGERIHDECELYCMLFHEYSKIVAVDLSFKSFPHVSLMSINPYNP